MAPINRTSAVVLVLLLLQTSIYTVLRKYSTMTEKVASKEILVVAEFIKIVFSIYQILEGSEASSSQGEGLSKLVWLLRNSSKMILLAALYMFMNILSFVSLEYIGAGEFTVCAQLKILTTVTFSRLILGTTVSDAKWRALIQLIIGCILVSSPAIDMAQSSNYGNNGSGDGNVGSGGSSGGSTGSAATAAGSAQDSAPHDAYAIILFGYGAVLLEVTLSGFATVYFEGVVKSKTEVITVWERNFQLAFYSMIFYVVAIYYDMTEGSMLLSSTTHAGTEAAKPRVLFENWSFLTIMVAFLSGSGGLLVAATLKYSDAIMKTLATAGAIVLASIAGYYFLDAPMTYVVVLGCITTIIAIMSYTFDTSPVPPPIPANATLSSWMAGWGATIANMLAQVSSVLATATATASAGASANINGSAGSDRAGDCDGDSDGVGMKRLEINRGDDNGRNNGKSSNGHRCEHSSGVGSGRGDESDEDPDIGSDGTADVPLLISSTSAAGAGLQKAEV